MTENKQATKFEILNQFIKDLSFEAPNSPKIFFEKLEEQPNIKIGFEIKSFNSGERLYEVNLHLTVENSLKDRVLYLIELSYSSMVTVNENNTKEENTEILLKKVPAYLFPFIRSIVSDLTRESGFPPFVLAPVNFENVEAKVEEVKPANQNA